MTPYQLESAARLVCKKRGIDPDGKSYGRTGWLEPQWEIVADEVKAQYEVMTAIAKVLGMEDKGVE